MRFTHYPENSKGKAEKSEHCGYWEIKADTLIWTDLNKKSPNKHILNENGIYIEQDGHYYVPVELIPVPIKNGKPILE